MFLTVQERIEIEVKTRENKILLKKEMDIVEAELKRMGLDMKRGRKGYFYFKDNTHIEIQVSCHLGLIYKVPAHIYRGFTDVSNKREDFIKYIIQKVNGKETRDERHKRKERYIRNKLISISKGGGYISRYSEVTFTFNNKSEFIAVWTDKETEKVVYHYSTEDLTKKYSEGKSGQEQITRREAIEIAVRNRLEPKMEALLKNVDFK